MILFNALFESSHNYFVRGLCWVFNLPTRIYFKIYNILLHIRYPQWNGYVCSPYALLGLKYFTVEKGTTFAPQAELTADGGYLVPDIKALAESYGLVYGCMSDKLSAEEATDIIQKANLIEYKIDGLTTVCPKLEYNKPIESPIPLLDEEEFEKIKFV